MGIPLPRRHTFTHCTRSFDSYLTDHPTFLPQNLIKLLLGYFTWVPKCVKEVSAITENALLKSSDFSHAPELIYNFGNRNAIEL